ncbi:MAG: thiamine phosphate synthase [Chloroflexota bacterium]|nr:thiamine phosphate synthase [Chloroflexota bacterium]
MGKKEIDWSLYVITDRGAAGGRPLTDVVRAVLAGGATVIQLREKHAGAREIIEVGQALHRITREASIPLIVNDRVDIALALEAEGVHVGQDDMPAALARDLMGPDRILGVSAGTVEEALQAEGDGADYLGVGDIYGTPTKPDAGVPIGIQRLRGIAEAVSIPVVGIGGINADNATAVIEAGAAGVAVISAVVGATDPEAAARQLRQIVRSSKHPRSNE